MADELTTNEQQQTTPPGTAPETAGNVSGQPDKQDASKEVQERIARAKRKTTEDILSKLGFDNLDAAIAAFTEVKQVKDGQLSAAEKAQKERDAAAKERDEIKAKYQAEREARQRDRVDGAIKEAAKGARNLKHVLILIREEHPDKVAALASDDGTLEEKAIEKLVTEFKTANPSLFDTGAPGSPSNRNGKAPEPDKSLKDKALSELRQQMRRMT